MLPAGQLYVISIFTCQNHSRSSLDFDQNQPWNLQIKKKKTWNHGFDVYHGVILAVLKKIKVILFILILSMIQC